MEVFVMIVAIVILVVLVLQGVVTPLMWIIQLEHLPANNPYYAIVAWVWIILLFGQLFHVLFGRDPHEHHKPWFVYWPLCLVVDLVIVQILLLVFAPLG